MIDVEKEIRNAAEYLKADGTAERWNGLSDAGRRYARHLVEDHGWDVKGAIERAAIFGYDPRPYDFNRREPVDEEYPADNFGF